MKSIIAIICSIILPVLSFEPKICVNCKFFRNSFVIDAKFSNPTYGKCALFPIEGKKSIENEIEFLVTGIEKIEKINHFYCSTARECEYMCGKEGKMYEKNDTVYVFS